jgi:hypothetical protein
MRNIKPLLCISFFFISK